MKNILFAIYKRAAEAGYLTESEALDSAWEASYVLSMFTSGMEKLINESDEVPPEEIEEAEKWKAMIIDKEHRRFHLKK